MRKLVIIVTLSAFACIPIANAQTTNQQPPATAQPKATPSTPGANTTTVPKTGPTTNAKAKPDRMARKATHKMRHARTHRKMGTYGYRASGKRLGYRSAGHRHHRVMGYRAAAGCR